MTAILRIAAPLLCLLGLAACQDLPTAAPAIDEATRSTIAIGELTLELNRYRASVGCGELTWDDGAAHVAQGHSDDMVIRNFFSHVNPDGKSPFDRLRDARIDYRIAGENIAKGYSTGHTVLDAWLASPSHRANIEDCRYTQHGVGLDHDRWTQVFVTPA
ncbi:hypothetical protein BH20GEM2_BH20GEM2_13550 [soil metagenome]